MQKVELGFSNGYKLWMETDSKGIITIGKKAKGEKAQKIKAPSIDQIREFIGFVPQLALPPVSNENQL